MVLFILLFQKESKLSYFNRLFLGLFSSIRPTIQLFKVNNSSMYIFSHFFQDMRTDKPNLLRKFFYMSVVRKIWYYCETNNIFLQPYWKCFNGIKLYDFGGQAYAPSPPNWHFSSSNSLIPNNISNLRNNVEYIPLINRRFKQIQYF